VKLIGRSHPPVRKRASTIRLWDVTTGAETARLEGHSGEVTALEAKQASGFPIEEPNARPCPSSRATGEIAAEGQSWPPACQQWHAGPNRQPSLNCADDMLRALSGKSAAAAGEGLILAADRRSPRTVNVPLTAPMHDGMPPCCPNVGGRRGSRRDVNQPRDPGG
jgi:hypothetical protein